MILGGDLGGTKTLLALAEVIDGHIEIIREQRFSSTDYCSFDLLLDEFLADRPAVASACFGVAGPIDGQMAQLTYLPWHLDAKEISQRFGIAKVRLANDFAAAANGLSVVDPAFIQTLHPGPVSYTHLTLPTNREV